MHAIHFHGSYRYDSRDALDRAITAARWCVTMRHAEDRDVGVGHRREE
jgi:hypothetical protein